MINKNQMNNMICKNQIIKIINLNYKKIKIDNKNQMNNNNPRMKIKISNNNKLKKFLNLMKIMIIINLINNLVRYRIKLIIV